MKKALKCMLIVGLFFIYNAIICVENSLIPPHVYEQKGDIVVVKTQKKAALIDGKKFFFVGKIKERYASCFSLCMGNLGWQCMELVHFTFYKSLCKYLLNGLSAPIALQDVFSDMQKAVNNSHDINVQSTAAVTTFVLMPYADVIYMSHGLCKAFVFRKNSAGTCEYEELLPPLSSSTWGFGCASTLFSLTSFPAITTYKVRSDDYALLVAQREFFQSFSIQNIADALNYQSYSGSFIDTVRDKLSISFKKSKKLGTLEYGTGCMVIPLIKRKNRKIIDEIDAFVAGSGVLVPHPKTGRFLKDFLQKVHEFIKIHKKNKAINIQTSNEIFNLLVIVFSELSDIVDANSHEFSTSCKDCISGFFIIVSELMGCDIFDCFSVDQQEYIKKWLKNLEELYLQKSS